MRKRPYEKLIAWQEADKLCLWIYQMTGKFPGHELYALRSQMRRSSYSVPTDIAEGNGRRSQKDKAHFFERAISSIEELHYQSNLAFKLKYITEKDLEKTDDMIQRTGYLIMKLRAAIV